MRLKVLSSGSKANGYLISDGVETLIIECGVKLIEVKKALDFDLSSISGCLLTHFHADHMAFVDQYLDAGIEVFTSQETIDNFQFKKSLRPTPCEAQKKFKVGNFTILPFPTVHDAVGSYGYVINHKKTDNVLFLTDSYYSKFKSSYINHFMVESNWCPNIVHDNIEKGRISPSMLMRLRTSHMSIKTCMQLLEANDLSKVKNIVLIHLSAANSNAKDFQKQVTGLTGKKVTIAKSGLELDFNLKTF